MPLQIEFFTIKTESDSTFLEPSIVRPPTIAYDSDAGINLFSNLRENVVLKKGTTTIIPTGFGVKISKGHFAQICTRSSFAVKGLIVGGGIIDFTYSGELKVILHSISEDVELDVNKAVAQIIVHCLKPRKVLFTWTPCAPREVLPDMVAVRENLGFGSSDVVPEKKVKLNE
jgi:dUTP pyrophosphatase